jgi:predicted Zn-dependent peptidase
MTKRQKVFLFIFTALFFAAGSSFANNPYLAGRASTKLPKFKNPKLVEKILPNAMRCYLKEDHTIPVVQVQLSFRAGGIYDPPDKAGLATIAGMTMRSGGAGEFSPEAFDEAVDDIGANISSWVGTDRGVASLKVLSKDLDRGLELLFKMIFEPSFDKKRTELSKKNILEALRRERDDPNQYADRLFMQMVYGEKSAWARVPSAEDLTRIELEDLREFQKKYLRPDNIILAVSGDFSSNDFLKKIKSLTKAAPDGAIIFPEVAELKPSFTPEVKRVKGPSTQAFVRLGHLGVRRHNPEWFAIQVMNNIFGQGGFKSRLMSDIRTNRGLAYSISGGISQGSDYGLFEVKFSTSAKTASLATELVLKHIEEMALTGNFSDAELDFAKRSILSSAVFEIDSAFKIASGRARFYFYGYPPNYWRVAYDGVKKVSADDVGRVAKKYLHPNGIKLLYLGPN